MMCICLLLNMPHFPIWEDFHLKMPVFFFCFSYNLFVFCRLVEFITLQTEILMWFLKLMFPVFLPSSSLSLNTLLYALVFLWSATAVCWIAFLWLLTLIVFWLLTTVKTLCGHQSGINTHSMVFLSISLTNTECA